MNIVKVVMLTNGVNGHLWKVDTRFGTRYVVTFIRDGNAVEPKESQAIHKTQRAAIADFTREVKMIQDIGEYYRHS